MRITTLTDFIDSDTDTSAIKLKYHQNCWQDYVLHPARSGEDHIHL